LITGSERRHAFLPNSAHDGAAASDFAQSRSQGAEDRLAFASYRLWASQQRQADRLPRQLLLPSTSGASRTGVDCARLVDEHISALIRTPPAAVRAGCTMGAPRHHTLEHER
jgi:hypothetical protein